EGMREEATERRSDEGEEAELPPLSFPSSLRRFVASSLRRFVAQSLRRSPSTISISSPAFTFPSSITFATQPLRPSMYSIRRSSHRFKLRHGTRTLVSSTTHPPTRN